MTARQHRFVEEYCLIWNGTQAAIKAGYAEAGAYQEAYRLLRNAEIRAAIAERQLRIAEAAEVSGTRGLLELKRIAFADPRAIFDGANLKRPDQLDPDTAAAIASIEVVTRNLGEGEVEYVSKVKFHDKLPAVLAVCRRTGVLLPETTKPPEEGVRRVIFEYADADQPSNKTGI